MQRLFLLDAYALIFRAYYAFIGRPMRNSAGLNTSAIFGFTKFLRDIIVREKPRYLGVAFDPRGGNFRHELYPQYKANRSATPEDIITSVPYIKRILEAMCIPVLEVAGWEADDVIGTLSVRAAEQGFSTYMVTPDKDYGQLVSDRAVIYKQGRGGEGVEIVDKQAIKAQYGIDDPRLVIDILALWGDASDNVPGVPGIGEKGAAKLVGQFGTVEHILAVAEGVTEVLKAGGSGSEDSSGAAPGSSSGPGAAAPTAAIGGKMRENLLATREQLLLSKRLVTIDTDVPIEFVPAELEMCDPDCGALREIYNKLGFNMFLREMAADPRSPFVSAVLCRGTAPVAVEAIRQSAGMTISPEMTSNVSEGLFGQPLPVEQSQRSAKQKTTIEEPTSQVVPERSQPAAGHDLFSAAPALETISTTPHEYRAVETIEGLRELVAKFNSLSEFAYDTETTGYDCFSDRMVGISLCAEPGKAFWVPLMHISKNATAGVLPEEDSAKASPTHTWQDAAAEQVTAQWSASDDRQTRPADAAAERIAILKPLFENENIAKIGQNIKFDDEFMRSAGIEVKGRKYDTMILHYLLDPESRHGMDHLANKYLNYSPIPISSLIGSGARQITMDMVPPAKVAEYAAEDADVTMRLYKVLRPMVEEQGLTKLYLDIEEPMIGVLEAMEMKGVRIDTTILGEAAGEMSRKLTELEAEIRRMTDDPILNINSSRQLGEALFGKMGLGGGGRGKPKMTKTRQYSTDEETLQGLRDRHPIVGLVLEYRGVKKLLSTYIDALPLLVNPVTGRIHTSYNQAVTATGRLSSTGPNLQNIPVREEQGRAIRRAFVPSDGRHQLLSADYSQVELRLMAHLSGDGALIEAFRAGEDIHRATAARIFGVALDQVTPEQRRRAKTANFGIIYGISAFGLAQRLAIPRTEAADIIEGYFRSYPGVKAYMERVVEGAREKGYVETIFGRRRFLADINSRNAVARGLAERNAINAPIQGSAADIMKIAMIRIFNELQARGLQSKMILQVHDEVVVDLLRDEREEVTALVVDAMESAARLSVDLVVDYGVGEDWLDAH